DEGADIDPSVREEEPEIAEEAEAAGKTETHAPQIGAVAIVTTAGENVVDGEMIQLTAVLEGSDGVNQVLYIWEIFESDHWEEVARGESNTYAYAATADNLAREFRVRVLYK
ncbi:MAG: hypothetical protein IJ214_01550, partial [Clostridia bacterium]|nr:hypothetical protein [Clostridia bacterium]